MNISASLFILNNEYLWPRQCENISVKTSMALKLRIFSPANLSLSTVCLIAATIYSVADICSETRLLSLGELDTEILFTSEEK